MSVGTPIRSLLATKLLSGNEKTLEKVKGRGVAWQGGRDWPGTAGLAGMLKCLMIRVQNKYYRSQQLMHTLRRDPEKISYRQIKDRFKITYREMSSTGKQKRKKQNQHSHMSLQTAASATSMHGWLTAPVCRVTARFLVRSRRGCPLVWSVHHPPGKNASLETWTDAARVIDCYAKERWGNPIYKL